MKRIKQLEAEGIYLLEGQASANSVYFESKEDIRLFLRLANYFFKNYFSILEYVLQKDGWMMVVKIHSEEVIMKSYEKRRKKSKVCKEECTHSEVWRIISDQMRLFLSQYVKQMNARNERSGSLVASSYVRKIFVSLEECQIHVEQIRKRLIRIEQRKTKYRGTKSHFRVKLDSTEVLILMDSGWMSNKERRKSIRDGHLLKCLEFIDFGSLVALNLIKTTLNHHFPNFTANPKPNSS